MKVEEKIGFFRALGGQSLVVLLCLFMAFPSSFMPGNQAFADEPFEGEWKRGPIPEDAADMEERAEFEEVREKWRRSFRPPWGREAAKESSEARFKKVRELGKGGLGSIHSILLITLASIVSEIVEEKKHEDPYFEFGAGEDLEGEYGKRMFRSRRVWDLPYWESYVIKIPLSEDGGLYLGKSNQSWHRFKDAPRGWVIGRIEGMGTILQVDEVQDEAGGSVEFDPVLHFLPNPDPDPRAVENFKDSTSSSSSTRKCDFEPYAERCVEVYELDELGKVQMTASHVIDTPVVSAMLSMHAWSKAWKKVPGFESGFQRFVGAINQGMGNKAGAGFGRVLLGSWIGSFAHMQILFPAWEAGGHLVEMAIQSLHPDDAVQARRLMTRLTHDSIRYAQLGAERTFLGRDTERAQEAFKDEFKNDVRVLGKIFEEIFFIVALDPGLRKRLVSGVFRERLLTGEFIFTIAGLSTAGIITEAGKDLSTLSLAKLQSLALRHGTAERLGIYMARTSARRATATIALRAMSGLIRIGGIARAGSIAGGVWGAVVFVGIILVVDHVIPEEMKQVPTEVMKRVSKYVGEDRQRQAQDRLVDALESSPSGYGIRRIFGSMIASRGHVLSDLNHLRDHAADKLEENQRELAIFEDALFEATGEKWDREKYNREVGERFKAAFNPYRDTMAPVREALSPRNPINRLKMDISKRLQKTKFYGKYLSQKMSPMILEVYDRELEFLLKLLGEKYVIHSRMRVENSFILSKVVSSEDWLDQAESYEDFANWIRPKLRWEEDINEAFLQYLTLLLVSRNAMAFIIHSSPESIYQESWDGTPIPKDEETTVFGGERYTLDFEKRPSMVFDAEEEELKILEYEVRKRARIFGWEEIRLASMVIADLRRLNPDVLEFMPSTEFTEETKKEWEQTFGIRKPLKHRKSSEASMLLWKL